MTETDRSLGSDDATALAQRLRDQRGFLNLSQQFVSEQTGIPRSAISDIERGARRVDSIELKRLAELYRMPVDYFLGQPPDKDLDAGRDMTVQALARAASEMSKEEKEQVLRFALFLQNYKRRDSAGK
jgi:transcriptional regulator with XRE-family HTH domain